jgi:hypothetical protein
MRIIPLDPIDEDNHTAIVEDRPTHQRFASFGCLERVSYKSFKTVMARSIDDRPCDSIRPADSDWGEQDSLANVPRQKQPLFVKLIVQPDLVQEGDI